MQQLGSFCKFSYHHRIVVAQSDELLPNEVGEQQATPEAPKAPEQGALPECPRHPRGVKPCR